ncbi:transporter [Grimontia hollisae]|uniref:BacA bacteroid development protein n=1 Tax=Grimontia hollisae CIP 101886 TaxID=675812 RepID=D0I5K5_GRIHO|nr:peptide antibiotic transporter SbmA [Grimontia hollisae]AMG29220.1 transporter [Grimontia hollisae]EEY73169.1 bacA bacteroid development protein [Grimontia hollisae CIP 101886]MDF2184910.1 peptide antibiotic transporter SbmA [Grimontia hollisae]STO76652.1 microcin B17 transporter [Grimontia hollisae]STQ76127.1 microcin B17 transporter [Grimontia hollisae]
MFKSFFLDKRWFHWSILGSALILYVTWYKVELDVQINEWFGTFYNLIQKALAEPNTVTFDEFLAACLDFLSIATIYIVVAVLLEFFIRHYVFRWRTAMNDFYVSHWSKIRHIEGASQRIQEDTMRFARIVESLGVSFMRSLMTLFAFLPILWVLSENITELPWIGEVSRSLVYIAILSALFGTVLLAIVGIKLPGLEFKNQKVEAAYRKELVYGEDHEDRATPESLNALFFNVRRNYFNLYKHYLYFDIAKWSYLQGTVIVPYIALGPTIVSGAVTLGVLQQIIRAFGKVEESFQFLVNSWSTIVELMSIYKRLKGFEEQITLAAERPVSAD